MTTRWPAIPVARPLLGEREVEAAGRAIRSGWVTQGPEVAAFEQEFAAAVGAAHACAVSSCTTALHLALLSAGVGPGDEVVTVSHSFIATANAIRYCGALPVFVDVEPDTFNINPSLVDAAVTSRTKALLLVHQLGMPCDLPRLVSIGRGHGLAVIEDAACAVGSEIRWQGEWQRIGRPHGDIACFSFHPRKLLSTGDGGMLVMGSAETAARVRRLRQHGMSMPDTVRHASAQVVFEEYAEVGFNYRLTDIQAAVGREQVVRLPEIVDVRRRLADRYREALQHVSGIDPPFQPDWARSNWQSYAVRLRTADQRLVMQRMLDDGVATRRGVMNVHREAAYPAGTWRAAGPLVEGERAQDTGVVLPLYHQMTSDEQDRVIDSLTRAVAS